MIQIKEVSGKKGIKQFVLFPFRLYKGNPYWIPPLIRDEIQFFNPDVNPVFETAQAWFYIAYRNGQAVGRIAVIANWHEMKTQNIQKIRFGWFDFIDDTAVSKALLNQVFKTGRELQLEYAEGPIGFSNMDKVGVLSEGYEELGSMATWYNYPYYIKHYEKLGFRVEKEFIETSFNIEDIKNSDSFSRAAQMVENRYNLKAVNFSTTAEIMPYVDEMFNLFNRAYASLPSFVAVTEKQKDFFKKKYLPFINPKLVKFIFDSQGKMVSFSVVMNSFSKALQKSKGRLFPFGIFHLLKARKNHDTLLFYLIGIEPEYQKKGLNAIIFREYYQTFVALKVKQCIQTPELVSNQDIQNLWKNFNPQVFARRCTYRKSLSDWEPQSL